MVYLSSQRKFVRDFYSSLAQSVEHLTVNQGVTGSSPVGGAKMSLKIIDFGAFFVSK